MRDFKGMKRQRGRNRGGNSGGGGGGKPQHNVNRAFESNGPDNVKIRGNAQHVFEKYQQLARDAMASGDRVLGENYLQHAEHYFRVLRAVQPNRPASEILGRDALASGFDIDFEDETGANAAAYAEHEAAQNEQQQSDAAENGEQRAERQDRDQWRDRRDERPRDNQSRDDRPREDRQYRDRDDRPRDNQQSRDNQSRDDRPRDNQPRDTQQRDDRPKDDRPREDRPREGRRERFRDRDRDRNYDRDRPRDPMAVVEPESTPLAASEVNDGPRLRSQDGSESHAPAFLQARPPAASAPAPEPAAEDGEVKKPRRRRAPRSFEGGEGEAPKAAAETEEA